MVPAVINETVIYNRAQDLFTKHFGSRAEEVEPLSSHGSERIILRMRDSGGGSSIAVNNNNIKENRAFIGYGAHFRKFGLNVPEIYCVSDDETSYLMQDLGNTTLLGKISENGIVNFGKEERMMYLKIIEILPRFQVAAGSSIDYSYCYQFGEFAEENIRFDLNYFYERFMKQFYKHEIDDNELNKDFEVLSGRLLELDRTFFMYRDFQSRNIMISDNDFYFIDFQSGRRGALLYDIASLLYDAKAGIPQSEREYFADYYLDVINNYTEINKPQYSEYFWYFAVIRILQAMGAYGFLGIVKEKKKFLASIPPAIKNIRFILENRIDKKHFKYLRNIFREIEYEET